LFRVQALGEELARTVGGSPRITASCLPASAAANRNYGLRWAETANVIMVDDDVTGFPAGWNLALEALLDADRDAVMVSANLMTPDGRPGPMLGCPADRGTSGVFRASAQQLPTACVCIRREGLRFDEAYEGSGWEDTDYCAQLRALHPRGKWLVASAVRVTHRNEKKNQGGEVFKRNRELYTRKWGRA
jgi:hypothetical protein